MPINVAWCAQYESVIRTEIILPWNWVEFRAALTYARNIISEAGDINAIVIDVRLAGDFPPKGFIQHSRYALAYLPSVPIIFLSDTRAMQLIMQPIIQVMRTDRSYHFVHTEAAVAKIIDTILTKP